MVVLRRETKVRARALQLLYAWELQHRPSIEALADGLQSRGREIPEGEAAVRLVQGVAARVENLDDEIAAATEKWRLSRIGLIERNILRLGLHELLETDVPAKVAIDEGVRLAQWFAGEKAPGFVNGVLDALARRHGRL